MKYLIYSRVSTDKQDVASQIDSCKQWIQKEKQNAKILVFEDHETSSMIPMHQRTALMAMLDAISKDDIIVVAKLDRLARKAHEATAIYHSVDVKKAKIYSLAEGYCEPWMKVIHAGFSMKEREIIGWRTKQKLDFMKREGQRTGHIPYGKMLKDNILRTDENKGVPIMLIDNPEEIAVLKEMQRLSVKGCSYVVITELLNEKEMFNRNGKPWSKSAVGRVIKNLS